MALDFPNSPTNGQLYTSNNVTWEYDSSTTTWDLKQDAALGTTRVAVLRDQKNYDKGGGYFYGDYWRDRDLTVIEDPSSFVTFVPTPNGQTTESVGKTPGYWSLPAGTYEIQWGAGGFNVNRHQTRLVWSTTQSDMTWTTVESTYSTTTADNPPDEPSRFVNNECFGSNENVTISTVDAWTGTWSKGTKVITITETTWFKVLHIAGRDDAEGFGTPVDSSAFSPDRYTTGKNIYAEVRIRDLATAVKDNATYVEGKTKFAYLYDAKSQNTGGGSATASQWNTRVLNTKVDPESFVSWPGGASTGTDGTNTIFSLPAGSYKFEWRSPSWDSGMIRARLAYSEQSDFSSGVIYVVGETAQADSFSEANTFAFGVATITITATTYFRIEHYPTSVNGSYLSQALGVQSNVSTEDEIYTQVMVMDLATAVKNDGTTSIVKQIKHASGPSAQTSYNSGTWTTIVQESITLTTSNNVLIDVKAGFYGGSEDTAYNGGRLLRTTSSVDTSLWEYSSIWGRVNSGSGFKASIDGPTVVDTPGTGTHTYQWQTSQHDASGSNDVLVPANGNSITLTEYT